jgi:hypothetical protein
MKLLPLVLIMLVFSMCVAQDQKSDLTQTAITETALDYADGFYSGAPERMEHAIHPDLNKVTVVKLNPTAKSTLQYSTYSGLIEMTRAKLGFREPDKRNINVTVLKVNDNLASVKLKSAMFNDYLQMVKVDDNWKIVNVLWELGPETPNLPPAGDFNVENESQWVITVVKNYYDGSFENDATKVEEAIYPELRPAQLAKLPQSGKEFINRVGAGMILEATRAKLRQVPEDQRKLNIDVLDVMEKMAFVEAVTPMSTSYFHLAKIPNIFSIGIMMLFPCNS